ncbi:MAG: ABC transporter permease [Clostridiales Family XIII bacterium]|jgi:ribose/xylose/arabinose/galactoside ABC-type transport system permease subunit|nr:ABC transporter permease [Clostridiales Family XIII bacterium]
MRKIINNDNRIYLFLAGVFIVFAIIYPNFFTSASIKAIMTSCLLPIAAGIGFTVVMIGGNFDLSIGSVINAGAVVAIGEFNRFYKIFGGSDENTGGMVGAWVLAFLFASLIGCGIGAINGFLVAKVKVHSFIVTIGMLTAVTGFVYTYTAGNTLSSKSSVLVELIDKSLVKAPYIEMVTPRFLVVVGLVILFEIVLVKTKWGYDLFMVGSNKEASFYAGIKNESKVFWSFVFSGFTAALGGALFAVSMNAAVPNYGERGMPPLMLVLASTIIGGTVMTGGSGSVVKTMFAVITLQSIFSGLMSMGMGFDAQVLAAGGVLGAVVLYESYSLYRQDLRRGERPALLPEAEEMKRVLKA